MNAAINRNSGDSCRNDIRLTAGAILASWFMAAGITETVEQISHTTYPILDVVIDKTFLPTFFMTMTTVIGYHTYRRYFGSRPQGPTLIP